MEQTKLFNKPVSNNWKEHWKDMPEFDNVSQPNPLITATFKFRTEEDYKKFKDIVQKYVYGGKKVFDGMQKKNKKNAWYPHNVKGSKYKYIGEK